MAKENNMQSHMQTRHFELIAKTIGDLNDDEITDEARETVATALAEALKHTSAKFDYNKFMTACGV